MKLVNRQNRSDIKMERKQSFTAAVVVAHPDDETIWVGGTVLMHPDWQWTVVALCRGSDPDRAPKFSRGLQYFGASGGIGDLDDGLEQSPLPETDIQETILSRPDWNVQHKQILSSPRTL